MIEVTEVIEGVLVYLKSAGQWFEGCTHVATYEGLPTPRPTSQNQRILRK